MLNSTVLSTSRLSPNVKKLDFEWNVDVEPGQFIMIWSPGIGEIPMSVSHLGNPKSITVKSYGIVSSRIMELAPGEMIYFRGPFGNSFDIRKGKKLLIGGGSGMASLHPLIGPGVHGLVAGRTSSDLLFSEEFEKDKVTLATDDGSVGIRGTAVDALRTIDVDQFDSVYVCGPELMMYGVMKELGKYSAFVQFSLERNMKCGIGVCDSCSIDGFQLCTQGPVFEMETVKNMREFGKERLNISGRRIKYNL
ncbi:MAG: dihydroorotate dehydrogenase electron transfer subunit [Candidatus Thermoplasmatota archaeon]|nr:dihydroorotate dehydrogenase electron transfer subunit [Candidatus Thermoplasmatota archaeon]